MTFQPVGQMATKIVDRWRWWQTALADPSKIGTPALPIHESEPQQGYFRVRTKAGDWEPVALFFPEESDTIVAYRNGQSVAAVEALWIWCCRQPITVEAYDKAMAGGGWDDEPERAPGIGDNSGEADPLDAIRIELAGEIEQVTAFMKVPVENQAQADRLGIWAKRLTDLGKKADNHRVVEKEPHLAASRAVDDKWRTPIADAKDWAAKAKNHVTPFLIAQKRAEEERARKAREEAEAAQRAAAEAARKAQEAATQPAADQEAAQREADRLAAQAREAERATEVRNASAGRTGARVSIRTEKVGVVTDYAKAAAALVALKHPDLLATIDNLANRAAKAGMPLDGVTVETREKVQ